MDLKKLREIKIPRRHYLRPQAPSRREHLIGYIILVIVIGVIAAVFISGQRYDPKLFSLDPKLLEKNSKEAGEKPIAESGERTGTKDGEARKETPSGETTSGETGTEAIPATNPQPTAANAELIPANGAGNGWVRDSQLQRFTSDNLYDKIDGRENLYKSYEFKQLFTADFTATGQQGRFIQVELFDMTTAKSALGVFATERPAHPNTIKLGRDAYTDTNGVFFWKGQYYVRVIGSDTDKSTQQATSAIARAIEAKLPDSKDDVAIGDPLPTAGRVPDSFALIGDSAFGQSFLRNVSSARYKVGKLELTGFVMTTESAAKASSTVEEFGKAMASFGKLSPVQDNPQLFYMEALGSHYIIFAKGRLVGGVMEAEERDPALKVARQIFDYVKEK
ncbi:MAG: DUF6599 family protein [Acidobacteriota bacterium]